MNKRIKYNIATGPTEKTEHAMFINCSKVRKIDVFDTRINRRYQQLRPVYLDDDKSFFALSSLINLALSVMSLKGSYIHHCQREIYQDDDRRKVNGCVVQDPKIHREAFYHFRASNDFFKKLEIISDAFDVIKKFIN